MKERLLELLELFKQASPATRITLVTSTLAVLGMVAGSSWYASRPDWIQPWTGLSSAEAAEYKSALAQAGIRFQSSPPPENGIWVDVSDRNAAEAQVALAGFKPSTKGIQLTDGGIDSAFISARSRQQMAEKREWQECELQLEHLSFVERATVGTSSGDEDPYGRDKTPTISVTLGLRHGVLLDDAQARTVATLVRSRFNVPLENITVVDERGNLLHDGTDTSGTISGADLFAQKRRYDREAERNANQTLEKTLGPGLAHVQVNSVWEYKELETISESHLPDSSVPVYTSSSTSESKGPASPQVGGPAGVSSNITEGFGMESVGVTGSLTGSQDQRTENEETRNAVGREIKHERSRTPVITRLTVALIADESVAGDLEDLEGVVKAAVGFDASRQDLFESYTTRLASVVRDDEGNIIPPAEPEPKERPNQYVQMAIEHGVELLAALTFIFVLLKSLKGAKAAKVAATRAGPAKATASGVAATEEIDDLETSGTTLDPELLARVQVEDLVKNDPERVSEILAQWASESAESVGANR